MKVFGLQTPVTKDKPQSVNTRLPDVTWRGRSGQLCASSRGNTETPSVIRIHWAQRVRRRPGMSEVKAHGSTVELPLKLSGQSIGEVSGIPSVAVKCVDIRRNTKGEGSLLDNY
eukprot:TRINITY_DN17073_c0_g1_i2.p4 TRINITY_DN17073_c0_g1~~TRINITY_DN17073_c0_g1_i2.p4  ORF type:complete len:114 (+),score=4.63 TRINITY_DN17073_c0_g1_i2:421-762(+)